MYFTGNITIRCYFYIKQNFCTILYNFVTIHCNLHTSKVDNRTTKLQYYVIQYDFVTVLDVKEEFPKENIDILFGFVAMMFVKNGHWLE